MTTRPTGQWLVDSDGHRWWFESGALALDFAYTGPIAGYAETLAGPDELSAWLTSQFGELAAPASESELKDAKALRASIADAATSLVRGDGIASSDVDVINLFAATPDIAPALDGASRQAGRSRVRTGQALSALARAAVELFSGETGRIRQCAASDCSVVFYDESRSNNRRWCSMQRCGNRAKVRSFRATRRP